MNNKRPAATVKRIVGVLSAVMLFSLPMSGAVAKDTGYIFVSSENDNAVTVLDGKTHAVVKTIATGERPRDMKLNAATPQIEVDPETYEVRADGELLTCEPAAELPLAQRYFLF